MIKKSWGVFVCLKLCGKMSIFLLIAVIRVEKFLCCLGSPLGDPHSEFPGSTCLVQVCRWECWRGTVLLSALQLATWAGALHHFFFLPSGAVCLSYVLLGKKTEFCSKSGYFQLDCVQLCDQMTCSTISWVAEQWTREDGRDEWVALKAGVAQLRRVRFSDASWLEGEHGDCSSRGHPRPVSGGIPPQFVTLMLDFTTVTDISAPVQMI